MKIKTMTATFGKLQGERLTLEPGLNVITAPTKEESPPGAPF